MWLSTLTIQYGSLFPDLSVSRRTKTIKLIHTVLTTLWDIHNIQRLAANHGYKLENADNLQIFSREVLSLAYSKVQNDTLRHALGHKIRDAYNIIRREQDRFSSLRYFCDQTFRDLLHISLLLLSLMNYENVHEPQEQYLHLRRSVHPNWNFHLISSQHTGKLMPSMYCGIFASDYWAIDKHTILYWANSIDI